MNEQKKRVEDTVSTTEFKRVLIWSGWFRLSHAATGLSTIVLLATGVLISESPSLTESALDIHYLAASVFVFGLLIRLVLLFVGKPHERLAGLIPSVDELGAMKKTVLFYLSLGRASLPHWYAHNPLWKPVYCLNYMVLVLLAVSGAMIENTDVLFGFYLPSVHAFWAQFVLGFSLLHIIAVCAHDYRNQSTDVSAIINGYRLFQYVRSEQNRNGNAVQFVTLDSRSKDR